MAGINYQYELMKMYLAAFIRPPEKSGLEYWLLQLNNGKSFDGVLDTVFSLDIVKDIYPSNLTQESFVTLIYANVFGRPPDLEGLRYWEQQLTDGRSRGNLVMDMINAGLSTPDGTSGKAYIVNRLAVSQFAVDQQFFQKADLSPAYLKSVMLGVNANPDTITTANKLLGSGVTGIGLGAPTNALSVAVAANGISAAEAAAGVTVVVDLTGTNAVEANSVELLIDGQSFPTTITKQLIAADITAKKVSLLIPNTTNWGPDGIKLLQVVLKNNLGSTSPPGGDLQVDLNLIAPKAPNFPLFVPAAENTINLLEKTAGVAVQAYIADTGAVAGDKLEILLNGVSFTSKVIANLSDQDIASGIAEILIPGTANWGNEGEKILSARVIDKAGNIGGIGGNISVTLDTLAPNAPTNAISIPASANGLSNSERAVPVTVIVDLTGSNAKQGDAVELLIDNKVFGSSTIHTLNADEIAAKTATLFVSPYDPEWTSVEGIRSVSARIIDSSGNASKSGGNLSVLVDSIAPKTELTSFVVNAAKDGISAAEVAAGVLVSVNLQGSGVVAGDTIRVLLGTTALYSQVITAAQITAKVANLTIPLSSPWGDDGNKLMAISFTDIAGNTSAASPSMAVILDTTAPLPATTNVQVPVALNGINIQEKAEGVLVNVNLSGTQAQLRDKVEILLNGAAFATPVTAILSTDDITNSVVSVLIPGNAIWGLDGDKLLSARIIDVAGNIGAASEPFSVLIDTTLPTAASTPLVVPANADGGISIVEKNLGVAVSASLVGTNIKVGDRAELLIGGIGFSTPVTHLVTDADLLAQTVTFNVGPNDGWGTDGVKSLSVRFIDFAGNVGLPSGLKSVTLDSIAPNPTSAVLSIAAAQNGINLLEKNTGFDAIVDLNGTGAVSGDTLHLYIDGLPFTTPIKQTITAAQALAKLVTVKIPANADWGNDGNHVLSVVIVDAAGNPGNPGGTLMVQVDTTPPTAATNPVVIPAAVNGVNNAEKNVGIAVEINLAGTNSTVSDQLELLLNGSSFSSPIVRTLSSADIASGLINLVIPSAQNWGADGSKSISFRVTDVAGNRGSVGGVTAFVLDTSAPAGPTTSLNVPANTGGGISLAELNAGISVVVNLTGAAVTAGDSVEILIGGVPFSTPVQHVLTSAEVAAKTTTLTIAGTSVWGADGVKNLTARFIDIAGNVGTGAGLVTVTVDTSSPNSVSSPLVVNAASNAINSAEKNAGVDVLVDLTGTGAVSGDQLQIFIDGQAFSTPAIFTITAAQVLAKSAIVKIPGTTNWGADGNHVLSASLIDKAGNIGSPAGDLIVLLDTTVPNTPVTPLEIPAANNGINNAEKLAGVAVTVRLGGTGVVAGDRVELLIDGKTFLSNISQAVTASDISSGQITLTIGPTANWGTDGAKNMSARFIDAAGNVGAAGANLALTLDTSAPVGPTNPLTVPANSSGGITTAELIAGVDVIVNLTGTKAVAGEMVEILINGNSFARPVTHVLTAAEITAKTVTLTVGVNDGWGGDGVKALTARYIDSAGNLGSASGLTNVTVDVLAPNPVTQAMVVASATNGISNAERAAGVSVVVDLTGTGVVAGDTITLYVDGVGFSSPVTQKILASQVSAKSATVIIPGSAVWGADGTKTLTATLTDAAGNTSAPGGEVSIVLDTLGPNAPTNPVSILAATNGVNAAEKTAGVAVKMDLSGTAAVTGDNVELLINGASFATPILRSLSAADMAANVANLTIPSSANWGSDGVKNISYRVIDAAGNVGASSAALSFTLDTLAPTGPTMALVVPANVGGGISQTELNAGVDVIVNLTGATCVAGDTVEILIAGSGFATPVTHVLTSADILAKSVTLTVRSGDGWGGDGVKPLTARFVDIAGNVGAASGLVNVTLDAFPPNPVTVPLTVAAALNGISNAEKLAGVSVVVNLTGTGAVAGDKVALLIDGVPFATPVVQTITAAQATAKSVTLVIPSSAAWGLDGNKVLSATLADTSGNTSVAGGDISVLLDTTPPVAPSNAPVIAAALNGIGASEKTAGVTAVINLAGSTAVVGDRLELLIDGVSFSTPVNRVLTASDISNGSVSLTIASGSGWGADGNKLVSASVIDVAGNIGSAGPTTSVVLDTQAPAGPTAALLVPANSGGGITTAEKNAGVNVVVNLTGTTVVAGDVVEILLGGLAFTNPVIHTLSAAEVSAKSVTVTVGASDGWGADGTKILTARFIDIAGNIGANTGSVTVTIDGIAPNPLSIPMAVAAATNAISNSEKNAGVSVLINLSGTGALAGDTIHLYLDGADFSTPVTQVLTAAQVSANLVTVLIPGSVNWGADGNKVLTATITDVLGNVGTSGGDVTVVLDTIGPSAPSNNLSINAATNGISLAEKSAGVSVVVDLAGLGLVSGESIELLLNSLPFPTPVIKVLNATEVGNGLATITIPGAMNWGVDGSKNISVRGIDMAGNSGIEGGNVNVTLDTTGPSAPANSVSVPANGGGGITAAEKNAGVVVNVDLTGTGLVAGEAVELLIGGSAFATPLLHTLSNADIIANFASLTIGASDGWGSDGTKVIGARFIDLAGNIGLGGGTTNVLMLDTTPPTAPNSPMTVPVSTNGINLSEKNAGVSVTVSLAGTNAAAGDVATLLIGGSSFAVPVTHTITAGEVTAGNFNFIVGSNDGWGADGSKVLSMLITDVAGNVGPAGGNVTVQLDATLPNAPANVVNIPAAASGINLTEKTLGVAVTVDLTGTNAVAGDKVEVLLGGVSFAAPVFIILNNADILAASANLTIAGAAGWGADGVKSLSARIEDSAGNIGLPGGSLLTNLDTVRPSAVGLPIYTDVDNSSTINAGDTYEFVINEATDKSITLSDISLSNGHVLGAGATAVWSLDGKQLTVTLGTTPTIASGDIVTLIGVSDMAGNAQNLAFSI